MYKYDIPRNPISFSDPNIVNVLPEFVFPKPNRIISYLLLIEKSIWGAIVS